MKILDIKQNRLNPQAMRLLNHIISGISIHVTCGVTQALPNRVATAMQ